jgi:hypothetical protein
MRSLRIHAKHMGSKNLYLNDSDVGLFNDSDVGLFEKLEKLLEQRGKSICEFFADTARNLVEVNEQTHEVELQGAVRKRIFKGQQLYWDEGSLIQTGVFYTPKGSFVYWSYSYGDREKFGVYGSLSQLYADNHRDFEGAQGEAIRNQIDEACADLMRQQIVEYLDI